MKRLSKQITLGYDPVTGKRIRKRIYATSEAGLKQAEKEMIRQYAQNGISSHMTYDQYEKKWWEAYAGTLTPSTQKSYRTYLRKNTEFRHKQMQKIIRPDLQKVINDNFTHPELCKTYVFLMSKVVIDDLLKVRSDNLLHLFVAEFCVLPETSRKD